MRHVSAAGKYVEWGVISISLTNLLIIVATIIVFMLAVLLPFPHHDRTRAGKSEKDLP